MTESQERAIRLIRANAGTGKTFRLISEYISALGNHASVHGANDLIATTFTNKAAAELLCRIRQTLISDGLSDQASAVLVSSIGTVNSVCGRIVTDLSIDGGLSPSIKLITESQQKFVFETAIDETLDIYESELWPVIHRTGKENSWRNDVMRICDIARTNKICPERFTELAESSWTQFKKLLPVPARNPQAFEVALIQELTKCLAQLPSDGDDSKGTQKVIEIIKEFERDWKTAGELSWAKLIRLRRLYAGKRSRPIVEKLIKIAIRHDVLPEFQSDVEQLIMNTFKCAADCLQAYKTFKLKRGLIDFIDQEELALSLLQNPEITPALSGRFSSLFVDEFQDTSPMQLAIFLKLADIVESSSWVGDEKQSIYGFRGADSTLLQSVTECLLAGPGSSAEYLQKSYRSRPELVEFINSVFADAGNALGFANTSIRKNDWARTTNQQLNLPLHVWWLPGTNMHDSHQALAIQIKSIMNDSSWVVETQNGSMRQIRGSDIAILCRSNSIRLQLGSALSRAGILVSTERPGHLDAPECILAVAVLRYLADKYDTLALAEILRFTATDENDGKQWLYDWLSSNVDTIRDSSPMIADLDSIRSSLSGLTPTESLQVATTSACVLNAVKHWKDSRQRLLNLEALLSMSRQYEEYCEASRNAATVGGLIVYLNSNISNSMQPSNLDQNAVQILTYHKAKGLEWPAVILYDLDAAPTANIFGVNVSAAPSFNATNPLQGRGIRYYPWPYGYYAADIDLAVSAKNTLEANEVEQRENSEIVRLLYVGMTRPRDYLIFVCQSNSGAELLDLITDSTGTRVFQMSPETGLIPILRKSEITADSKIVKSHEEEESCFDFPTQTTFGLATPAKQRNDFAAYSFAPSSVRLTGGSSLEKVLIERIYSLGKRLDFSEQVDLRLLGDALHFFLATDDTSGPLNLRLKNASEILAVNGIIGCTPDQFLEASNRLNEKLDELYQDALFYREWPVSGRLNGQRVFGTIDLLLELSEGFVIIDHKTFPGDFEAQKLKAIDHFPQIDTYARLVEQASSKRVVATFIHMPVIGSLFKLSSSEPNLICDTDCPSDPWLVF